MLGYHERVAEALLRSSGCLAVLGRGLGAQTVLLELLRRTLEGGTDSRHAARLVLLVNTPPEEAELLLRRARADPRWDRVRERLVVVGPELSVEDRAEAFTRGGVFVVSARLLVPDLLSGRLVAEAVNGIVVNHAHGVGELSAEAFALRIFRKVNMRGFVRAVSDRPESFSRGHAQVEQIMQRCFIDSLEVWPRIRKEVQQCLAGSSQPEVCQKTLQLPPKVREVQQHVLSIIESTLDELRKDPNLNLGHLTVQSALFPSFESELRQALDPVRQSLGPRARRLVVELAGVRQLLGALLRCDAVEFLGMLDALSASEGEHEGPAWTFSPEAQALHTLAKSRVYELAASSAAGAVPGDGAAAGRPALRRTLEPHAKWQVLFDVIEQTVREVAEAEAEAKAKQAAPLARAVAAPGLASHDALVASAAEACRCAEVPGDLPSAGSDDGSSDIEIVSFVQAKRRRTSDPPAIAAALETEGAPETTKIIEPRLLVVVPDDKVKRQISSVLHHGPDATLLDALGGHLRDRTGRGARARAPREPGMGGCQSVEAALLAREAQAVAQEREELAPSSVLQLRELADGRPCHPRVDLAVADGPEGALEWQLREARPHAVVLVEPCLHAIRALEVLCAERGGAAAAAAVKREIGEAVVVVEDGAEGAARAVGQGPALKAYLLVFEESVEKYRFQQGLVQESSAVDALIKARHHHTVRLDAGLPTAAGEEPRSSRRGGGSRTLEAMVQKKVVVDMREFRSALPFMLYQQGLTIEPVTIPVGDYILSRDICVERKARPAIPRTCPPAADLAPPARPRHPPTFQ